MKLTESEVEICQYLTQNDVTSMSADTVAKKLFTSRSSIYRVCKKMGYSSFSHFKFTKKMAANDHRIIEVNTLDYFDHVSDDDLPQFISSIKEAKTIYIVGLFASKIAGSYFVRQLMNLGYKAFIISDSFELIARIPIMNQDDVLIFISNSGSLSTLIKQSLINLHAPLLAITQAQTELTTLSQVAITFDFIVSKDDSPFVRENVFNLLTIVQKVLINLG